MANSGHAPQLPSRQDLDAFRREVDEVAIVRDLATATGFGVRLNRLISGFDRSTAQLSPGGLTLLELAHTHIRAMMNCPRRMRLDDTWQDDFVAEARAAADVLISIRELKAP